MLFANMIETINCYSSIIAVFVVIATWIYILFGKKSYPSYVVMTIEDQETIDIIVQDCFDSNGISLMKSIPDWIDYVIGEFNVEQVEFVDLSEFNFDLLNGTLLVVTNVDSSIQYKETIDMIQNKIKKGCVIFGSIFDKPELPCSVRQIIAMVEEHYNGGNNYQWIVWDDIVGLETIKIKPSELNALMRNTPNMDDIRNELNEYYSDNVDETFELIDSTMITSRG